MAAGLQPAVELAMMSQRHVLTGGVHHDGAGGQVGVLNGAIKGRLVRVDKRANIGEVGRFSGVLGHVGRQLLGQGRPCSASRTSRRFSSVRPPRSCGQDQRAIFGDGHGVLEMRRHARVG